MRFSVVYFVLLSVLLGEAATATYSSFFTREQKLSEFKHKLEQQLASPLASPPTSSQTKMVSNRPTYIELLIIFPLIFNNVQCALLE